MLGGEQRQATRLSFAATLVSGAYLVGATQNEHEPVI